MSDSVGVIWDFDGTLAERPGLWAGCLLEVIEAHDPALRIRRADIDALMMTGFPWHTPDQTHPELSDPEIWWQKMIGLHAGILQKLGLSLDLSQELAIRLRTRYVDGSIGWRVFPEAVEVLDRLQGEGHRQVILSNHVPELAALVKQLGLSRYFDAIITSALTGYEKPHPGAYAKARECFPADVDLWMIGDNEEADALGPEEHGIHGIFLCRSGSGPHRAKRRAVDLTSAVDLFLASSRT